MKTQISHIASQTFVRRSFTRYRFGGVAAQSITFGYLDVRAPAGGAPKILAPVINADQTVTAFIKVTTVWDVRLGDILKENVYGRLFQVIQCAHRPGYVLLFCSELLPPIPDEFNAQSVEAFWSSTASGFGISTTESSLLLSSMPAGTLPSSAKGLYQLVRGDFDIWSECGSDAGSGGNVRITLIGARHPSTGLGCYAGGKNDGANIIPVRQDEYAASTLNETTATGVAIASFYARLKRMGGRFQAFYKAGAGAPATDSDWTEIPKNPAVSYSTTDDLRVGAWAYTNNSTNGLAIWNFIRNWVSS